MIFRVEGDADAMEFVLEEAYVKPCVMGNDGVAGDEPVQFRKDLFGWGLAVQHGVCDAMDLLSVPGDFLFDIDQGIEFGDDFTVFDGDRADFDDPVSP